MDSNMSHICLAVPKILSTLQFKTHLRVLHSLGMHSKNLNFLQRTATVVRIYIKNSRKIVQNYKPLRPNKKKSSYLPHYLPGKKKCITHTLPPESTLFETKKVHDTLVGQTNQLISSRPLNKNVPPKITAMNVVCGR